MDATDYTSTDIPELKRLAEQGDAEAMEMLAWRYAEANRTIGGIFHVDAQLWARKREDYWQRRAMAAWRERAEKGDSAAWQHMADLLRNSPLYHPQQELEWTRRAAEGGDADACIVMGEACETGRHVPRDAQQAAHWHERAAAILRAEGGDADLYLELGDLQGWREHLHEQAEAGSAESCGRLASLYRKGMPPFPQDDVQAAHWQEKAETILRVRAESGDSSACLELAWHADGADARHWFQRAAELGHSEGMFQLGQALRLGKDLKQAYQWLQRAAEKGHPGALGQCFVSACISTREEKPLARHVLDALGKAGHAEGCYILGLMHASDGVGVLPGKHKREHAIQWLEKAAAAGDMPEAAFSLGMLLCEENAAPAEKMRAHAPLLRAAEAGDADAACLLALLLWQGIGAPANRKQALHWAGQAAADGQTEAALTLLDWLREESARGAAANRTRLDIIGTALMRAAERGNPAACLELAHMAQASGQAPLEQVLSWGEVLEREIHLEDPAIETTALDALTALAQAGEAEALAVLRRVGAQEHATPALCLRLAHLYTTGCRSVPADWDEAIRWFAQTCGMSADEAPEHGEAIKQLTAMAEKKSLPAIRALYELETAGISTTSGKRGRLPAILKVAKKKGAHPEAMFLAGELLRLGGAEDGVWQDPPKAADYYARAAEKGHEGAKKALQHLPAFIALYQRAGAGDAEAHWRLGQMHESGDDQRKNSDRASEHYAHAALCGHTAAAARLRQMAEEEGSYGAQLMLRQLERAQQKKDR